MIGRSELLAAMERVLVVPVLRTMAQRMPVTRTLVPQGRRDEGGG